MVGPSGGGFAHGTGHCESIMVSGSVFNIVNGLYSRLASSPEIWRRSDNLQLPGLLINTAPQQWCLSFAFSSVDINSLTLVEAKQRCGESLQCCMLISESPQVDDPNAVWIVNMLENKGKQDGGIKVTCEKDAKGNFLLIYLCFKFVNYFLWWFL